MRFVINNPVYLWFLLSIPVLVLIHFFTLKSGRGLALKFSNFEAIERVSEEYRLERPYLGLLMNKNLIVMFVRALALLFLVFALSNVDVFYLGETTEFDFVLAIDASTSMLAGDLLPTRLGAAKDSAMFFVEKLPEKARVGLVSFAGTSFVENKLTEEKSEVMEKLRELKVKDVGGTDLGGALVTSTNLMLSEERPRIIILLTDGRSNVGITTEEAIKYVNESKITVYTIGVATESGGAFSADNLVSTLDERTLRNIAEATNGRYFLASNKEELDLAYSDIANIKQNEVSLDLTIILMIISLVLIFLEWLLINTKYLVIG